MVRSTADWRRRIAGQMVFDEPAAEVAIRRAYRAAGLPVPERILWADGPRQAAETLHFLARPPRRQRRLGLALLAGGAVLWPALALGIAEPGAAEQTGNAALLIAAVLGFYLTRLAAEALPRPPSGWPTAAAGGAIWAGAGVYAVMLVVLLAIRHVGLAAEPLARGATLAIAGVAGALPGVLLLARLWRAYHLLPESLRRVAPGRSVVRRLVRGRQLALARATELRPDESVLRAYRSAYTEAFARPGDFLLEPTTSPMRRAGLQDEAVWMAAGHVRRTDPALFRPIPPHIDGIEDAEVAYSAERDGGAAAGAFADLAYHVDRLFAFHTLALAVRPATTVSLDADGRAHAESGPALTWADGTEVHVWRGRVVDPDLLDDRLPLTLTRILRERDRDRRWVLIERYGLGRFLTENAAAHIHADHCGTLYRLEQPGEPIVAVRVVNGTPEPDGTFREFWLRVPPTMRTAREAVAWTFGLTPEEYDPVAQS